MKQPVVLARVQGGTSEQAGGTRDYSILDKLPLEEWTVQESREYYLHAGEKAFIEGMEKK